MSYKNYIYLDFVLLISVVATGEWVTKNTIYKGTLFKNNKKLSCMKTYPFTKYRIKQILPELSISYVVVVVEAFLPSSFCASYIFFS